MANQLVITFERDIPEAEAEGLRGKIRAVLRGEAVPAAEVMGQWDPGAVRLDSPTSREVMGGVGGSGGDH